jgi:adenylate kinase family enzyme
MASKAESGNYIVIEDVRASYDHKRDVVEITSGDKDLTGFMMTVKSGTVTDNLLRAALVHEGVMRPEEFDSRPSVDFADTIVTAAAGGVYEVIGRPGAGKSFLLHNIARLARINKIQTVAPLENVTAETYEEFNETIKETIEAITLAGLNVVNGEKVILLIDLDALYNIPNSRLIELEDALRHFAHLTYETNSSLVIASRELWMKIRPALGDDFVPDAIVTMARPNSIEDIKLIADYYELNTDNLIEYLNQIKTFDYLVNAFGRTVTVGSTRNARMTMAA